MDGHRFEVEREFFCRNAGGTSVELLEASAARGAVAKLTSPDPETLLVFFAGKIGRLLMPWRRPSLSRQV
jgi:hypothetical protein